VGGDEDGVVHVGRERAEGGALVQLRGRGERVCEVVVRGGRHGEGCVGMVFWGVYLEGGFGGCFLRTISSGGFFFKGVSSSREGEVRGGELARSRSRFKELRIEVRQRQELFAGGGVACVVQPGWRLFETRLRRRLERIEDSS
jgi:hypothetical protein